jgi:hypothetical protein
LPKTAEYLLRVKWVSEIFDVAGDVNSEHYGLAWFVAVPEPASPALVGWAICAVLVSNRHRAPHIG